jgi:aquaporin Z
VTRTDRNFHWPEYLMEAAGLGGFMISACTFGALLEYPGSTLHAAIPDPTVRRVLMGLATALTAVTIVYSLGDAARERTSILA